MNERIPSDGVLLAFDTSSSVGSVAVGRAGAVLAHAELEQQRKHASALIPAIRAVLLEADVDKSELDGIVVGEGPMKNILERKTRDLNIENQVIFTGFQQNALGILADVDVAVEAGTYDTLSRVALETMGAGTPLVANDVGAIRELVNHEENGLLIRYGDEDEFTNALLRLVNDEQLRTRLAKNGYMTISEQFSIERYASKIEDIYLSILGK